MKALSLTQPWAAMIAYGGKQIETRSWQPTNYSGWLLIHAAQGFPADCRALLQQPPFKFILADHGVTTGNATHSTLPRGAVCAVARLVGCLNTRILQKGQVIQVDGRAWNLDSTEWALGDYRPGRYAWLFADVTRLTQPILAKGRLGLWQPSLQVQTAVEADLLAQHYRDGRWDTLPADWT